ncbi:lipid droplet assembly factor 1 isoform X1 [Pelobates fuscus]|uniref:lipid droplet assembly factor 1 isoform X1 n=2 Tax=Pelobates fuscus TaxID=191477 RepID=UPI002FE4A662
MYRQEQIRMSTPESLYREKMQELQKQLNSVMQSINNNSKVVSFMNSPVGQYLDEHPYISLSLLIFVALSAIPVGLFLSLVAGTAIAACLGVIVLEGVIIIVGGLMLLCVLCGIIVLSFGISGVLSVCYIAVSSILNYLHTSRLSAKYSEPSKVLEPGDVSASKPSKNFSDED